LIIINRWWVCYHSESISEWCPEITRGPGHLGHAGGGTHTAQLSSGDYSFQYSPLWSWSQCSFSFIFLKPPTVHKRQPAVSVLSMMSPIIIIESLTHTRCVTLIDSNWVCRSFINFMKHPITLWWIIVVQDKK